MRLVDSEQMREMDRHSIEDLGVPSLALMENASRSFIAAIEDLLKQSRLIFVLCGSGNNGGDGYAIARQLKNRELDVVAVALRPPKSPDCLKMANIFKQFGEIIEPDEFFRRSQSLEKEDILIDAVLGTGGDSPLKEPLDEFIRRINEIKCQKVAVDIPSGIQASTGDLMGMGLRVKRTVTFQKHKVGLHLNPGKAFSGEVKCVNISVSERYKTKDRAYYLIDEKMALTLYPRRGEEAYKNQLGHLATYCGSKNTLGASLLASYAGLKSGVGLVTQALPLEFQELFVSSYPELMNYPQEEIDLKWLKGFDALVIGCGLGRQEEKWQKIAGFLKETSMPVLLDADVFYGLKSLEDLRPERLVLTPHPGEFKRLSGFDPPKDNGEKIKQGLAFIALYPVTLVLKGAPTLIFSAEGEVFINSTGNPAMATAGSGDVLSGIVGAFLARGLTPLNAAILGVWAHGMAGDYCRIRMGSDAVTAMSLIRQIKYPLKKLEDAKAALN
ncbi:MAG: NAD(P)H-hydrate dehydratase [Deltaproteobacteria bacterium]|nr:NAD(P)H-hydrate dehydratase [Deltaproteobacteria bacterium]